MSLYKDASLVMIPSAYKDGKLYSIRPTDGSGDFTFSRGSNLAATRVDVNGLIEKGRENVLLQSNQFDTTWASYAATETGGQIGYDGTSNAWLLDKSAASGNVYQDVSISGVNTYSVYVKGGTNTWVALLVAGPNAGKFFNLSGSGAVGSNFVNAPVGASIESIGSGWFRISIITNASVTQVRIYPAEGDGVNSGTSGNIYIQDAQVEQGLVATDYIETGTSAAQSGILEDMPRLDYSGSCPSLLLEPQRTNINAYSEYFLHSQAVYTNASGTANAAISPEGVQNAHKLLEDTANARHRFYITGASAGAGNIVVSAFLKDGNRGYGALHLDTGTDGRYTIIVDLSDGSIVDTMTFGTPDVVDEGVEPYGDGWYRAYIVLNKTSSANVYPQIGLASSDSDANSSGMPAYQGDGTHYIYCYGIQLELGSYPTSYIPTYGTSQTRSDDYMQVTPTDLLGSDSGTWFMELNDMTFDIAGTQVPTIYLGDSTSNCLAIEPKSPANNKGIFLVKEESNVSTNLDDFTISGKTKFCFVWSGTTLKVFRDGVQRYSATNFTQPANWDSFVFNHGSREAFSEIPSILLFPTALTDSECIALTTL